MKKRELLLLLLVLLFNPSLHGQTNITFKADMRDLLKEGWDSNIHALELRGSFNGWSAGDTLLVDPSDDSIYVITKSLSENPGDTIEWKFKANPDNMFYYAGWDHGDNRKFVFPQSDSTLPPTKPLTRLTTGLPFNDITFQADMRVLLKEGFDPTNQSLEVRGSFNGWEGGDVLSADLVDDSLYVITTSVQWGVGDTVEWKYKANPDDEFLDSGWEFESGNNRKFVFPESDSTLLPIVPSIFLKLKLEITVFFQGPYNEINNNMNNPLGNDIPLISPYSADPQEVEEIPPNVVDWVLVELRDKNNSSSILNSRSAFVLKDGSVVDTDGNTPVRFSINKDDYFIAVKHRNHLSIMSLESVEF